MNPGLIPPHSLSKIVTGNTILFNWTSKGRGEPDDTIHIAAFNPALNEIEFIPETNRIDGSSAISIPSHWNGHKFHLYAFARNKKRHVSDIVYGGEFNSCITNHKQKECIFRV